MDGVAGVSASSCWRSVVACWGACRYNMGNVWAHEAQYAGAAVMVAEVSPMPPRWSCVIDLEYQGQGQACTPMASPF